MKKITMILLSIIMVLSLGACGGESESSEYDVRDEIKRAVNAQANVECVMGYANVKLVDTTCTTIDDNGDGTYDVKGYVVITDDYHDKYKGYFDAVVSVDESGDADVDDFELETPVKQ